MDDLFATVLSQLRAGRTQEELSDELRACVNHARETGKKAVLTLAITITPVRGEDGETGQYDVTDKITTKNPEYQRGRTLFFGTPEGNLEREDPRQGKLDLREVHHNLSNLREVK